MIHKRRQLRRAIPAGALTACPGHAFSFQSALDPAGPHAEVLADLWWVIAAVATAVTVLVIVLLLFGVFRAFGKRPERPLGARPGRNIVIAGGIMLPLVVVIPFALSSFSISRQIDGPAPADALTIEVVGRLWWWEIHYQDADGRRIATTANEIHIPVGQPVQFLLTSDNVIHSFWVPNLQGKKDMIPGQVNTSWLQADAAGVFRGQCAEFCGRQHGLMAFELVAEPPEQFERWLARERQPAMEPQTAEARLGREVFLNASCIECHTIRGTRADATDGPDLTHIGSRRTLAAATLPNNIGHLGGWVADPQRAKPGNLMPPSTLSPTEFKALIRYLESLK